MTNDLSDMHKQRKKRNYALGAALAIWVILIFVLSITKMAGGAA